MWLVAWFILSGSADKTWEWGRASVIHTASQKGVRVENIMVEGRIYTDPDLLMAILNTDAGDPLLDFDPEAVQPLIENISWVKSAIISRRLPDTIHVLLEERVPYALWYDDQRLKAVVIDDSGEILSDELQPEFKHLLLLSGENAPENARDIIELLLSEPALHPLVKRVDFIGQRRWNLLLNNDMLVKLPEQETALALRRFVKAIHSEDLLKKDVRVIDLRTSGRLIVEQ